MKRQRSVGVLLGIAIAHAGAATAGAQQARPVTIVDLIDVPTVSSPQFSPRGEQVVFERTTTDWDENKATTHIWRADADGSGLGPPSSEMARLPAAISDG